MLDSEFSQCYLILSLPPYEEDVIISVPQINRVSEMLKWSPKAKAIKQRSQDSNPNLSDYKFRFKITKIFK